MNKVTIMQVTPRDLEEMMKRVAQLTVEQVKEQQVAQSKYITREEAAEILRVIPQTVSTYARKGFLRNHGERGRYLFLRDEVINAEPEIKKSNWKR